MVAARKPDLVAVMSGDLVTGVFCPWTPTAWCVELQVLTGLLISDVGTVVGMICLALPPGDMITGDWVLVLTGFGAGYLTFPRVGCDEDKLL